MRLYKKSGLNPIGIISLRCLHGTMSRLFACFYMPLVSLVEWLLLFQEL